MLTALLLSLVPQDLAALDAHLRNVHLERREAFLDAWEAAGEPRRDLVRAQFQTRRKTGIPAIYQVSSQFLTENARVLAGEADAPLDLSLERRLACSLDLLILPGAFGAGDGGRGDEVIVRVLPATTRLFEPLPEQLLLRLVWIGPDGTEIPARQEPVHRSAFRMPGFEMYLRAPASKPGAWTLVPEVELDGRVGRGFPVPVACVLDLFGRADRVMGEELTGPYQAAAHAALERHLGRGIRDGMAPPIDALLAGEHMPPLLLLNDLWGGGDTLQLDAGLDEPRGILLVVAPELEEADWVFAGPALERWTGLAQRRGQRVFATALPVRSPDGADVMGALAGLRRSYPDLPLTLVVRGPAVGRLALTLIGWSERLPFDRIVVNTVPSAKAKARRQFAAPTLLLSPLFEAQPLERIPVDGPSLHWLRVTDPPVVVDRVLPLHIEAWLAALDESK